MAIFRVARIGGVAVFAGAQASVVTPPIDPPVTGPIGARFRPMRAANGAALFRGAAAVIVLPPVDPPSGEYVPKHFEEEFRVPLTLTYDAGDSQLYDDGFMSVVSFAYAQGAELEITDELIAQIQLAYDNAVQAQVEDSLASTLFMDFDIRARIRGWNDDTPLPSTDWTPDPKPNLF